MYLKDSGHSFTTLMLIIIMFKLLKVIVSYIRSSIILLLPSYIRSSIILLLPSYIRSSIILLLPLFSIVLCLKYFFLLHLSRHHTVWGLRDHRGRDRMVVGYTTTCGISVYA
jgi:hypothetical protein